MIARWISSVDAGIDLNLHQALEDDLARMQIDGTLLVTWKFADSANRLIDGLKPFLFLRS